MFGIFGALFSGGWSHEQARAEAQMREAFAQMDRRRLIERKQLCDKILAEHVGLRVIDEPGEPPLLPAPEAK